ncbi:transposase [Saccharopolyspora taberi]|uniref:transposase n=1 Tax=Saccharopolyspora taberi TaxID=60895 RepID=UPI003CD070E8
MARGDLTDEQWAVLEPLLPRRKKSGRPPIWTKRQLVDGIRFRGSTGIPWRDCRRSTGPGAGCTTCSAGGSATAPGSGSSLPWRPRPTPRT